MEIHFLLVVSTIITFRTKNNFSHATLAMSGRIGSSVLFTTVIAIQFLIPVECWHLIKSGSLSLYQKLKKVYGTYEIGRFKKPQKNIRLIILTLNCSKLLKIASSSYTTYRAIAFNLKENQNELSLV